MGTAIKASVVRMEHVHLGVRDIDRSVEFYRRAFGFEVRHDGTGMSGRNVHIGTEAIYIALSGGNGPGDGGVFHWGFVTEDLPAFVANLEREGIPITEHADRAEGRAVYINDPDGYEMEIVGYRPDYKFR